MLEIKFRIWGKIGHIYSDDETVQKFSFYNDRTPGLGIKFTNGDKLFLPIEDVELFTGHKDKNAKEIYAGDIIETEHGSKGIMKWYINSAGFQYDTREPMWAHPVFGMGGIKEIIGNVSDNPELLKGGKK